MSQLAKCPYFDVRLLSVPEPVIVSYADGSFVIVTCTEGNIEVDCDNSVTLLQPGETILVPADRATLTIAGNGKAVTAHIDPSK